MKIRLFIVCIFVPVITVVYCDSISNMCGTGSTICGNGKKYRSYDGSCNNLKHPRWGTAGSEYGRLLPAKFSDLNGSFPLSVTGEPLPNARRTAQFLFPHGYTLDKNLSLNSMAYGQFITHDLSFTYLSSPLLVCCSNTLRYIPNTAPQCAPIHISKDDEIYGEYGCNCMSMPRTDTNRKHNCSLEREQVEKLSYVTIYMDLHMIYGISNETAASRRTFEDGMLNSSYRHGQHWLPDSPNKFKDCFSAPDTPICYQSIDPRVNQNTDLTLLHIIYLREHLRIASELKNLNPHWDDERIYQETRNIVISVHQHISYDEWLQNFFGRENLLQRKVIYNEDIFIDDYDDTKRPITFNEFAHGANRHFHSMMARELLLSPDGKTSSGYINMTDWMNNPTVLETGNNFDDLLRGMQCQLSNANGKYHDVTSRMFKKHFPVGWDIVSIDIQRSRDHGLASYNDMREYCGLPKARNFSDFIDVISQTDIDKLKQTYAHVDDVELVAAGILETFVPDAITGPTFFCILMKQYYLTRISDRHWYQNGRSGLTLQQLKEINKSSISRLLCDNGKNITMIQPKGFLAVSTSNKLVSCCQLPSINLTLWKETV